jgi:hypothetical protein
MPADIEQLNIDCTCITLDAGKLCGAMQAVVPDPAFCRELTQTHPHLLSAQPLFLTAGHAAQMGQIVRAVEEVAATPGYRSHVLQHAPDIARFSPGSIGVFMGYDFHLGPDGPRLIEINTNAGGALINAYLLHAQHICCNEMSVAASLRPALAERLTAFLESFFEEWRRQRRQGLPGAIAIVDETPAGQYLYPEMVLFQRLFEQSGLAAAIADPEQFERRDGALWLGARRIDLVYNRLTDFALSQPPCASLREAYLAGEVVVTPNPWAHAHFADKRNLIALSDARLLASWGISRETIGILEAGIPRTRLLTGDTANALWAERDRLFFKPAGGYGSKAAYRGDKITRKVWSLICNDSYVAQEIVPPSPRAVLVDGKVERLKADLRCYTYAGDVLLHAARLYQGQTTNFRTRGGGFAPVFIGVDGGDCSC